MSLTLPYLTIDSGPALLDVHLRLGSDTAHASIVIDATDRRWPVLFYDPRPSWMSTFVRRSVEADPRFVVGGRVNTSRAVSSTVAGTPRSLNDPALPELYNVIVVGAPDQLSVGDVASLERFAQKRGGSVVLLFDEPPANASAIGRLTSVARWANQSAQNASLLRAAGDSTAMRATETSAPFAPPVGSRPLAVEGNRPVVWALPLGAGQLIVSGALDAWRYRDASTSSFESFWRTTIADAATSAVPPVTVSLSRRALRPGAPVDLGVLVRDATLSDLSRPIVTDIAGTLDDSVPVRLWPTTPGQFSAHLFPPTAAGSHHISLVANGNSERIDFVVDSLADAPAPDERELIGAWSHATGGDVVTAQRLKATLDARLPRTSRLETLHPMRSAWWILPFALLLAFEWWWRRRIGNS
jgi:hypothetical protein